MRFYTIPYRGRKVVIRPQYVMVNIAEHRRLFQFGGWDHAILDVGIGIFKTEIEYPTDFHRRYIQLAKYLTRCFEDKIWCVIPDYCDGENPGLVKDNVRRTLQNIERYHRIEGPRWIYPLQAKFLDIESFRFCCSRVRDLNPQPGRVAIGTVCKTRDISFIVKCCRIARCYFLGSWIHAFGLTLRALPHVKGIIDSFDSTAWAYPRGHGAGMATTSKQKLEYYLAYTKRIREILEPQYDEDLRKFLEPRDVHKEGTPQRNP